MSARGRAPRRALWWFLVSFWVTGVVRYLRAAHQADVASARAMGRVDAVRALSGIYPTEDGCRTHNRPAGAPCPECGTPKSATHAPKTRRRRPSGHFHVAAPRLALLVILAAFLAAASIAGTFH